MTAYTEYAESSSDAQSKMILRLEELVRKLKEDSVVALSVSFIESDGATESINAAKHSEERLCELLQHSIDIFQSSDGLIRRGH